MTHKESNSAFQNKTELDLQIQKPTVKYQLGSPASPKHDKGKRK